MTKNTNHKNANYILEAPKSRIKISALQQLIPISSDAVKQFCFSAGELYGKLALREQFKFKNTHNNLFDTTEMEIEQANLKSEIMHIANDCNNNLRRLNALASQYGISPMPCSQIDAFGISDFIEAICKYMDSLIDESDFRTWVQDISKE